MLQLGHARAPSATQVYIFVVLVLKLSEPEPEDEHRRLRVLWLGGCEGSGVVVGVRVGMDVGTGVGVGIRYDWGSGLDVEKVDDLSRSHITCCYEKVRLRDSGT